MVEWMPKLGDIKTIKGLSRIIVGPILVASYIANTGLSIENQIISLSIPNNGSFSEYWHYFLYIFLLKTILVLFFFYLPVAFIKAYQEKLGSDWFHIFGVLGLAFGFCGLFSITSISFFRTLHPSTYYASIVSGFYLLSEKWPD